jgi:hypothetical protein
MTVANVTHRRQQNWRNTTVASICNDPVALAHVRVAVGCSCRYDRRDGALAGSRMICVSNADGQKGKCSEREHEPAKAPRQALALQKARSVTRHKPTRRHQIIEVKPYRNDTLPHRNAKGMHCNNVSGRGRPLRADPAKT